jgi:hypothetical protein
MDFKPHVLEVNHGPSFNTDTKVDLDIKTELIKSVFDVL